MNRRIAITLLTILALLGHGAVSAAMGSMMMASMTVSAPAETKAMPCHDMPGMSAMTEHGDSESTAQHSPQKKMACCDAGSYCVCATACGTAALPMPRLRIALIPQPEVFTVAAMATAADAPPPHPFRPPIAAPV